MVATSVRPPGVSTMRWAITSSTTESGRPLRTATRSRSAGERGLRRIGDQGRHMSHAMHGSGPKIARGRSAVLIAGPTASGKSALALAVAERHRGVIVNADSMQVYRDLRIITARPSPGDEARIPHRLYGHVDAAENYSVGRWCRDAKAELDAAWAAGMLPILVGGTGLYFKALTQGLSAVPPTPPEIRAAV